MRKDTGSFWASYSFFVSPLVSSTGSSRVETNEGRHRTTLDLGVDSYEFLVIWARKMYFSLTTTIYGYVESIKAPPNLWHLQLILKHISRKLYPHGSGHTPNPLTYLLQYYKSFCSVILSMRRSQTTLGNGILKSLTSLLCLHYTHPHLTYLNLAVCACISFSKQGKLL
jgi:hypothetical protein